MRSVAPAPRLLVVIAAVGLPLALAGVFSRSAAAVLPWAMDLLLAVALLDFLRRSPGLDGLRARPAARIGAARGRPVKLAVVLERTRPADVVRVGLELPPELEPDAAIKILKPGTIAGQCGVEWTLTPLRRGLFRLEHLHLESASPWGFWHRRRRLSLGAELRVGPSLDWERKGLARFLTRPGAGERRLRAGGQGREFERLREYAPGDAFGDIAWKAMARRGKPVTKIHQVERSQEITVLLDASRLSARIGGRNGDSLLESHLRACLALELACSSQGDRFGLVVFAGRVLHKLAPQGLVAARRSVAEIFCSLRPSDESPDYQELAAQVGGWRRRRGLLVLLACLDDPLASEQCVHSLAGLARRHALLALCARGHGAEPAFSRPLAAGEGLADALAAQWRYQGLLRLGRSLRAVGAHLAWVPEERLAREAVNLYVRARERQWI